METIATSEAERVYERFAETVGELEFTNAGLLSAGDRQFACDAVGALLVTQPLEEGVPFSVEIDNRVQSEFKRYDGQEFDVQELGVSDYGTGYRVRFQAQTPDRECVYIFVGKLSAMEPPLVIDRAIVTSPKYI